MEARQAFNRSRRVPLQAPMLVVIIFGHLLVGCSYGQRITQLEQHLKQVEQNVKREAFADHIGVAMEEIYYAFYCDNGTMIKTLAPELTAQQITYTLTTQVGVDVGIQVPSGPNVSPSIQRTHDMAIQINLDGHATASKQNPQNDVNDQTKKISDTCEKIKPNYDKRQGIADKPSGAS